MSPVSTNRISITRAGSVFIVLLALLATPFAFASTQYEEDARVFIHFTENTPEGVQRGLVEAFGGEITHSFNSFNGVAAMLPPSAIPGLERNPHVALVEPDNKVEAVAVTYDTEYENAWGVGRIESGVAHELGNKGSGIKIGIIDSGVDYLHPDLAPNYRGGYDFYYYDTDPMDVYGHGTHVAGTACAADNDIGSTNPKLGVVGVAPECDLYSLRVLGDSGSGYESDIMYAIEWALGDTIDLYWSGVLQDTVTGERLDVVNLSLGSSNAYSQASELTFKRAEQEGLIMVAAAGNSGNPGGKGNSVIYPARYDSLIAVGATDANNNRASFSSTGGQVELAAPGVSVYSTWNDADSGSNPQPVCESGVTNCYKFGSGTSMASPHVAGVAALLLGAGLSPSEVRARMQSTAIDLGSFGRDSQFGYGLVNVRTAFDGLGPVGNVPPTADAGEDQIVNDSNNDGFEPLMLDGSGSTDANGSMVGYEWRLGDTVIGSTPSFQYDFPVGSYEVTLFVTDDEGATGTDSVLITVNPNQPPVAHAGMDIIVIDNDNDGFEMVTLNGLSSSDDGFITSYVWSENGTVIAHGATTTAEFTVGTRIVTLTVTDAAGVSRSDDVVVTVNSYSAQSLSLSALGYKVKGDQKVDLSWSGSTAAEVDIFRNGVRIMTTANDGAETDHIDQKGNGSYDYRVCEAGTDSCSAVVNVSF